MIIGDYTIGEIIIIGLICFGISVAYKYFTGNDV